MVSRCVDGDGDGREYVSSDKKLSNASASQYIISAKVYLFGPADVESAIEKLSGAPNGEGRQED